MLQVCQARLTVVDHSQALPYPQQQVSPSKFRCIFVCVWIVISWDYICILACRSFLANLICVFISRLEISSWWRMGMGQWWITRFFICYPANCYPSQGWWMLKVMKVRFCLMNSLLEIASMPRTMSVRIGFLFIKNMKGRQRVHCWLTSLEPNQRIVHWLWFWRRRGNFLLQLQDGGSLGGSVEDYSPHGRDSR